jgi:hypothetical protein
MDSAIRTSKNRISGFNSNFVQPLSPTSIIKI